MIAADALGHVRSVAKTWREEAVKRKGITRADPVADTLEYCASELEQRVGMLESDLATEWLTVEEYAVREGVTRQSVRAWIRAGELTAWRTAHGYEIPRDAERVRRAS